MSMQRPGRHLCIWAVFLIMCSCDWLPTGESSSKMTAIVLLDGVDEPLVQGQANGSNDADSEMQVQAGAGIALHASVTGGIPPYSFQWSAPGWEGSTDPSPIVSPATTTTYTLQVTDSGDPPSVATITVTVIVNGAQSDEAQRVAMPTFSPSGGAFTASVDVEILTATQGALIRYTIDGTVPTRSSGTLYTGPVHVTSTTILKAIAYHDALNDSFVTSAFFRMSPPPKVATPTFAPDCGTFVDTVLVTLSSTTPDATLRYTVDGSTPTSTSGIVYTEPITLTESTTIQATTYRAGWADSDVATATFTKVSPLAGAWAPLGTGMEPAYGIVQALAVYDGELIAGGTFETAGGTFARYIAAWDGTSWSALGGGITDAFESCGVRAMAVYNGELIAAGCLTAVEGSKANFIARWNGTQWSDLAGGVNCLVRELAVYDGKLIASGDFTEAGGTSVSGVAAWDGTSWSVPESGMNGQVYALTTANGLRVATESLYLVASVPGSSIAAWNGTSWSGMDVGVPSPGTLGDYYTQLMTDTASGTPTRVKGWNGTGWIPLCGDSHTGIAAIALYQDMLMVGGKFTGAADMGASRIAAWDRTAWRPLGSETDDTVFALTVYKGQLVAGGRFRTAGGVTVNSIAAWTPQ